LILFDCDGTLTDSHRLIVQAMQQAFASAGAQPPSVGVVRRVIGLSLSRAIETLLDEDLLADAALQQRIAAAYRDHYRRAETHVRLFPDVRVTLEALRERGYWLGVVTGKSRPGLLRVLEAFELDELFYVWRTADCTHSKPHPAMVQECMQELGVAPARTCVVGDAVFDVQMSQAAGVRALGVSFGVADRDALLQAGAEAVVDDFAALLAHFPPLPERLL